MYPANLGPTGKIIYVVVFTGTFMLIYVPLAIMMGEIEWSAVIALVILGPIAKVFGWTITNWIAYGTKEVGIEWFKGGIVVGALLGGTGGAVLGNQPFILWAIICFWAFVGGLVGGVIGIIIGICKNVFLKLLYHSKRK